MNHVQITRLGPGQSAVAKRLFAVMAAVFGEECESLEDVYLDRLLSRSDRFTASSLPISQPKLEAAPPAGFGPFSAHTMR